MFNLTPLYVCQDCDMDFDNPRLNHWNEQQCPRCGSLLLEEWYTCPACKREKQRHDFPLDEFDLCKDCLAKEIAVMEGENPGPARRQIIQFLKECS